MNILALDLSTHSSGWAVQTSDGQVHSGVIASAAADVERRIEVMRDGIIPLLSQYNIDMVIAEEVRPDGINARTAKVLTWLQGCLAVAIYHYNKKITFELIGPSSWRSKLGIQKYGVKREQYKQLDIAYANKRFNLHLSSDEDDEADALCILASVVDKGVDKKIKLGDIGSEESAF